MNPAEDSKLAVPANGLHHDEDKTSRETMTPQGFKHSTIDSAPGIGSDTESGWAAVAKDIRDIDEQKIRDYKEDIDTILVFAGLYSAVLSALLAESLDSLRPDPSDTMVALLSQVVVQTHTYTFNGGFLNSTAPPMNVAAIPRFQPTIAAKRVNVLWLASLTLSLISASFGILVKQWLREYMSGEYISPQAQLRIRHFRMPGLNHWRVFGIAALLPLVLQLALALFFVGLCFFTLDIHSSIGYTTIPLVSGWAFFFVAASLAPILSPRCPYKISILKPAMNVTRAALFHTLHLLKGMPSLPPKSQWINERRWTWWSLGYTEKDAARDAEKDVDILVEVDGTQTDDQLVMKMCSALSEVYTKPEIMIDFVLKIIGSRLKMDFTMRPLPMMLDLSQLPVQTCTILMDAVADVLAREVKKYPLSEPIEWTDLLRDCVGLLFARLPCLLSDKAMMVASQCFAGNTSSATRVGLFDWMFSSVRREERHELCLHLQERLRNAFLYLDAFQFSRTISLMMKISCCTCGECSGASAVLNQHADAIPPALKKHTCDVITEYLLRGVKTGALWDEWLSDSLFSLLRIYKRAEKEYWHGALRELVHHLVTKPQYAPYFFQHLFHRNHYDGGAKLIFTDAFPSSPEKEKIITNMHKAFSQYMTDVMRTPLFLDDRFCVVLLRFIEGQLPSISSIVNNHPRATTEDRFLPLYQMMWGTVHSTMCQINWDDLKETGKLDTLAERCLEKIDALDDLWLPVRQVGADPNRDFNKWVAMFNPAQSFFDDGLIEDIARFVLSPEKSLSRRVRRLRRKRELTEADDLSTEWEKGEDRSVREQESMSAGKDEAEHADTLPASVQWPGSVLLSQPSDSGEIAGIGVATLEAYAHSGPMDALLDVDAVADAPLGKFVQVDQPGVMGRDDTDRAWHMGENNGAASSTSLSGVI